MIILILTLIFLLSHGRYLEDDVALTEAGVIQINNILKESQNQHIRWPLSRLSVGGMLGILYDSRIVRRTGTREKTPIRKIVIGSC